MEGHEHVYATSLAAQRGRAVARLCAVAAVAMLLAPGPAAGRSGVGPRVPHPAGPLAPGTAPDECAIGISAGATAVAAGEDLALAGSLVCPAGGDLEGIAVTLYQHRAGTPGFDAVANTSTAADGSYSFVVPALSANSAFYVRYAATRHVARARSERVVVKVLPLVTLTSSLPEGAQVVLAPRGAHGGSAASNLVTLSGSVSAGARVVLQREQAGDSWRRVATGVVVTDGSYSFTHAFRRAGEVSLRVIARRPGEQAAASEALSFVVAQRQNPKLTISASPVRSVFGEPITISGVLVGAEAPVTLLARTPGSGFQEVARATTDVAGAYAFTQTPQSSTTYIVASGRVRSSTLFAPVSYALIAGVSPASPAPGEAVTVSGSVAPAPAGQVVHLQRRDAAGLGWRTVDTATTAADGSYSISRLAAGAQSAVFRVRVPRGERLAAASSQPFSLPVS